MEVMSSNDEDEKMIDIFKRCLEANNCLPLLKEEIKLKIQYKRIISGEDELKVEQTKNVKYLLTDEEVLKRHKRMEQNRRSAVGTRARQKTHKVELEKEARKLAEEQLKLQQDVNSLKREIATLQNTLANHKCKKLSSQTTKYISKSQV